MKDLIKYIGVLVCMVLGLNASAQSDFGTWFGAELKAPIASNFDLALEGQLRMDENSTHLSAAFLSPSITWSASKYLRFTGAYRMSNVPFNSSTINRVYTHRYSLDFEFRKILGLIADYDKFGLSMRVRGTSELESGERTENTLRFKLNADYNFENSKIEPYISGELFYRFNEQVSYTFTEVTTHSGINKMRLKLGASYAVKKRHVVKIFSIYQKQIRSQQSEFILGASYSHTLKFKKKKKKD